MNARPLLPTGILGLSVLVLYLLARPSWAGDPAPAAPAGEPHESSCVVITLDGLMVELPCARVESERALAIATKTYFVEDGKRRAELTRLPLPDTMCGLAEEKGVDAVTAVLRQDLRKASARVWPCILPAAPTIAKDLAAACERGELASRHAEEELIGRLLTATIQACGFDLKGE